jgi:hypothetical protein
MGMRWAHSRRKTQGTVPVKPLLPTKPVRLTLSPWEVLTLFAIVAEAAKAMDVSAERLNTREARQASDLVWALEAKISDKLTFG